MHLSQIPPPKYDTRMLCAYLQEQKLLISCPQNPCRERNYTVMCPLAPLNTPSGTNTASNVPTISTLGTKQLPACPITEKTPFLAQKPPQTYPLSALWAQNAPSACPAAKRQQPKTEKPENSPSPFSANILNQSIHKLLH